MILPGPTTSTLLTYAGDQAQQDETRPALVKAKAKVGQKKKLRKKRKPNASVLC
jgi:hypothetical protein